MTTSIESLVLRKILGAITIAKLSAPIYIIRENTKGQMEINKRKYDDVLDRFEL